MHTLFAAMRSEKSDLILVVCRESALDELPIRKKRILPGCGYDGLDITVYYLDDGWYANSDVCTHQDAWLAEGDIEADEIVCWCHGGAFDIRTGAATRLPCVVDLETFPVRVYNGIIETDFA